MSRLPSTPSGLVATAQDSSTMSWERRKRSQRGPSMAPATVRPIGV